MPGTSAETLLELLHYCSIMLRRAHHHMAPGGAHHGQSKLMAFLARHKMIRQKDLVDAMKIRAASLGELLGKLEKSGCVERAPNADDKRAIDVTLTPRGRQMVAQSTANQEGLATELFSPLDANEQEQLAALLRKLTAAWEEKFETPEPTEQEGRHHGRRRRHEGRGRF